MKTESIYSGVILSWGRKMAASVSISGWQKDHYTAKTQLSGIQPSTEWVLRGIPQYYNKICIFPHSYEHGNGSDISNNYESKET